MGKSGPFTISSPVVPLLHDKGDMIKNTTLFYSKSSSSYKSMQVHAVTCTSITADLPTEDSFSHPFTLSNSKLNVIMWNPDTKLVSLLELTVCFDTNMIPSFDLFYGRYYPQN